MIYEETHVSLPFYNSLYEIVWIQSTCTHLKQGSI